MIKIKHTYDHKKQRPRIQRPPCCCLDDLLCPLKASSLVVNFIYSLVNPRVVHKPVYETGLKRYGAEKEPMDLFSDVQFLLFIALLKAYLFYIVIRLLMKFDLSNPFSSFVSEQINQISYYTFSIGIISYIARQNCREYGTSWHRYQ